MLHKTWNKASEDLSIRYKDRKIKDLISNWELESFWRKSDQLESKSKSYSEDMKRK